MLDAIANSFVALKMAGVVQEKGLTISKRDLNMLLKGKLDFSSFILLLTENKRTAKKLKIFNLHNNEADKEGKQQNFFF